MANTSDRVTAFSTPKNSDWFTQAVSEGPEAAEREDRS
jgi:hypothetical protein